jgi:cell division protein FtsQ
MFLALNPQFKDVDMAIEVIELTPRGSWRVETESGATIEMGRGTTTELTQKLAVFLKTLSQVTRSYQRTPAALISADLRHKNGYALRLQGVTTVE